MTSLAGHLMRVAEMAMSIASLESTRFGARAKDATLGRGNHNLVVSPYVATRQGFGQDVGEDTGAWRVLTYETRSMLKRASCFRGSEGTRGMASSTSWRAIVRE